MHAFRTYFRSRPLLAAFIVVAALVLRVLVPGGYMPTVDHGRIVVTICTGSPDGPGTMVMAIPGLEHEQQPGDAAHGTCAYADLAQAMTGGIDPVLLAAALVFAVALALLLAHAIPIQQVPFLRPPLRGPPVRV